jgi:hypothetical protein
MAAQTHTDPEDFDARFRQHFPKQSNDFALVVLKGHLLLEESVNRLLSVLLCNPGDIEGANLRFHQKLCLIRALIPARINLVDAAEKLNILRNRLAHNLNHPQVEVLVKDFLSLLEVNKDEAEPLIDRLKRAIIFLCVCMERIRKPVQETLAAAAQ